MRCACLLALALSTICGTPFTAQEPPLAPPLAGPMPLPNNDAGKSTLRLEFRPGAESKKDASAPCIVLRREGIELEATRILVGTTPQMLHFSAGADGMTVKSNVLTTVCKSIDLSLANLGVDSMRLPSSKFWNVEVSFAQNSGGAPLALVVCDGMQAECTKLVLSGEKKRLEILPDANGTLSIKTEGAVVRGARIHARYRIGSEFDLQVTMSNDKDGRANIHLSQR